MTEPNKILLQAVQKWREAENGGDEVIIHNDTLIEVCDKCLCAGCWHGDFYCDEAAYAGTVYKTIAELEKLRLENPSHWIRQIWEGWNPDYKEETQ